MRQFWAFLRLYLFFKTMTCTKAFHFVKNDLFDVQKISVRLGLVTDTAFNHFWVVWLQQFHLWRNRKRNNMVANEKGA